MAVLIREVQGGRGFFRPGDELISIGGKVVEDQLDIIFLTSGEGAAEFVVRRKNGRIAKRRIRFSTFEKAFPVFEEMDFISCRSRCVFCFVDQMPRGMRKSLYKKDDDYRLSFLFGNFITLNDVSGRDLSRIVRYNLSPLYVSVHSTVKSSRQRLFGRPMKRDILKDLTTLAEKGITFHAQIVLIPEVNDGTVLKKTLGDLGSLFPGCSSVAIVPVGLTGHRQGLEPLRAFTKKEARELIDWSRGERSRLSHLTDGDPLLYMADEFYILAGRKLPPADYYGAFDQLSNGIGMSRLFIDDTLERARNIAGKRLLEGSMTLVTGSLGKKVISRYILPELKEIAPRLRIRLVEVGNDIFGGGVSVSGLLGGRDIIEKLRKAGCHTDCLVLPPNCVNHEGVMIDDLKPADIEKELGIRVIVPEHTFIEPGVLRKCGGGRKK